MVTDKIATAVSSYLLILSLPRCLKELQIGSPEMQLKYTKFCFQSLNFLLRMFHPKDNWVAYNFLSGDPKFQREKKVAPTVNLLSSRLTRNSRDNAIENELMVFPGCFTLQGVDSKD